MLKKYGFLALFPTLALAAPDHFCQSPAAIEAFRQEIVKYDPAAHGTTSADWQRDLTILGCDPEPTLPPLKAEPIECVYESANPARGRIFGFVRSGADSATRIFPGYRPEIKGALAFEFARVTPLSEEAIDSMTATKELIRKTRSKTPADIRTYWQLSLMKHKDGAVMELLNRSIENKDLLKLQENNEGLMLYTLSERFCRVLKTPGE